MKAHAVRYPDALDVNGEGLFLDEHGNFCDPSGQKETVSITQLEEGFIITVRHVPDPKPFLRVRRNNPIEALLQDPEIIFNLINSAIEKKTLEIPEEVKKWKEQTAAYEEKHKAWAEKRDSFVPVTSYACKDWPAVIKKLSEIKLK